MTRARWQVAHVKYYFLSRVSTLMLTRDIDIAILSVPPSLRP